MLGNIFYFLGLLIFIMSLSNLVNFLTFFEIQDWAIGFKKVTQKDPSEKDFKDIKSYEIFSTYTKFAIFESIWIFLGILSSNFWIFIFIILIRILLNAIISNFKYNFLKKYLNLIFNIFLSLCMFILVMNHFHFHYNLIKFIKAI